MNYTDRVAKGAAELDRILPGWEERIDLEILDYKAKAGGCEVISPIDAMAETIRLAGEKGPFDAFEYLADYLNACDAVEAGDAENYQRWLNRSAQGIPPESRAKVDESLWGRGE